MSAIVWAIRQPWRCACASTFVGQPIGTFPPRNDPWQAQKVPSQVDLSKACIQIPEEAPNSLAGHLN